MKSKFYSIFNSSDNFIPIISVEAEKMFSQLKIVQKKLCTQMAQDFWNALIRIRHDSNSFDKTKGTAVNTLRNKKQRII